MNYTHPATAAGQVISIKKSARYWMLRAKQHQQHGDAHRAAALLRHAMSLEPDNEHILIKYANALRKGNCFEASNRAAFRALSITPLWHEPYQLIGLNMLSLGREQEAADAFSLYLHNLHAHPRESFTKEVDDFFLSEDLLAVHPTPGCARRETLIHIASLQLSRGAFSRAYHTLKKISQICPSDPRLNALWSMYHQALGDPQNGLTYAQLSVSHDNGNIPALCALASVRMQRGERSLAATTLLKAIPYCRFPHQQQLFNYTAAGLSLLEILPIMLHYSLRKNPNRIPTLYNLAIIMLQQGAASEALTFLHRCRDLDPEDIVVYHLFHLVQHWLSKPSQEIRTLMCSSQPAFYPLLPAEAEKGLLETLTNALIHGLEHFAPMLLKNRPLYSAFLYVLCMPDGTLGRLLIPITRQIAQTDQVAAQRMLRDILLQPTLNENSRSHALSALIALNAPHPFVLWQNGRLLQASQHPQTNRELSVPHRLLFRRVHAAQAHAQDPRLSAHVLTLLYRMDRHTRYAVAADIGHTWQNALLRHFRQVHRLAEPLPGKTLPSSPQLQRREEKAFKLLCALWPL